MIFRRLLLAMIAAASLAASAAVFVVALAFALYALVEPAVGRPGAAGIVALAAAAILGAGGLFAGLRGRQKKLQQPVTPANTLIERAFDLVRQKPVLAAAAAIGAGVLAVRNPRYLGSAIRSFIEGRPTPT